MKVHAAKFRQYKRQPTAHQLYRRRGGEEPTSSFVDRRPEAAAQARLQELADNSPQAKQLKALRQMVDGSSMGTVQRAAIIQFALPNDVERDIMDTLGAATDEATLQAARLQLMLRYGEAPWMVQNGNEAEFRRLLDLWWEQNYRRVTESSMFKYLRNR